MMAERLIFTLSPGRCGTGYLAKMLATVPGVRAVHEGRPDFVLCARQAQQDPETARRFWLEAKLPHIETVEEPVYAETSHLFGKGFAMALLDLGLVADLVVLTRPHREVALSFWRRGSVPGRTRRGLRYLIHPAGPVRLPLADWSGLSDYQLCYWYCLEVSRRAEVTAELYRRRGARVHRTTLGEITTVPGFKALLDGLDLPPPDGAAYQARASWVVNATPHSYRRKRPQGSLAEMEKEVEKRCVFR